MHFNIDPLRTSRKLYSIMVVIDRLIKLDHMIPVRTTYSDSEVAQFLIREIVRLHGVVKKIVPERDAKLTSKFWKDFIAGLGI